MTRKFGGTGLGLTICARLVEMMGGRIWVESQIDQGSAFHFTIEASVILGDFNAEPVEARRLAGLPVLCVDDNPASRRILGKIASGEGLRPEVAASAKDALRLLQAQAFSLAVIDCQMPDMDGFRLAAEIKKDGILAGMPLLMLTAPGKRRDVVRCRELNLPCTGKPVDAAGLVAAMQSALGHSPRADSSEAVSQERVETNNQPLRILLVEDNLVNQKVARRMLQRQGHSVAVAANGREAIANWETHDLDLILMDIQMPDMDGLEATAAIRRRESGRNLHIPIVALTAHAMAGDRENCLAAGMDGYVTKPIRIDELLREIARVRDELASSSARLGSEESVLAELE